MRFLSLVAVVLVLGACASSPKAHKLRVPKEEKVKITTEEEMNSSVMIDAKKTVAESLGCPIEEVNLRCTAHDSHGGCTAVQGRGCDKVMEYSFGGD
jgi:predicted component of type VI protein secretion system